MKSAKTKSYDGFTAEERGAMKQRAQELKAGSAPDGESAVLEKIAEMGDSDRAMAERVHSIITASVPELSPRLWYGMPAYARAGKVVCFFQPALKFKARYATLGFSDEARLDDGGMWPAYFALARVTAVEEKKIVALLKQALS
jgi:uncharacterized protein YdhG (YjbR/CyaY superfamily)